QGLLEPLIVTPRGKKYMIAAGERRWRACKSLKLKEVPCIIKPELSDKELTELGIVENIQREDLTPIDEANAYKFLIDNCGYTQRTLGKRVGRTMAAINYKLSLLKLSPQLKKSVAKGEITATQGRSIVQSVNKVKDDSEKSKVLSDIKKKIDQAKKDNNGRKLDTKDVKIIASQTAGNASGKKPKTEHKSKSRTSKKAFSEGINSIYNTVEKLHLTNGSANACAKLIIGDRTIETCITSTTKAFNRLNDALTKIKKEKKLAGKK
ncbi:ParB/RepB/Spo0J family partition protein, partial [Candidatus Woesearchaeota archaeon]|nr:ParB/RepB/Spo0J family partition protein [Candidatus Woesearchaeota archaeon]